MNWNNWSDFLAMGGYGFYVWSSFGVTAGALLIELWSLALRRHALARLDTYGMDRKLPHETQT